MSHAFSARAGLILDTGATTAALNADLLRSVGYDPAAATLLPIDFRAGQITLA